MIKKTIICGLISICASISVVAQKNIIDEVIWVVGDEAILRSDAENYRLQMQNEGARFEGDPYCFLPEQIAVQKLYLSQAKIDSVYADESAVIRQVDMWVNYMINEFGSQEKLEELYGKRMSLIKEERKKSVREQQIVYEMQKNIVGDIRLTPSEVTKYFNQISKDSLPTIPAMVEIEIVTMEPRIPIEDIDAIKERLRGYADQIMKGESSMSTLAIRHSDDFYSAMRGGEVGMTSKITLEPEYATAAFALNDTKRVSPVVETSLGFHLIQLIEKRGDRINTRHILLRPTVSEQEVRNAISRLDSLRTHISEGKLTFEEAATYISADKDTKNNKGLMVNKNEESNNVNTSKYEMEELPQGMGIVIEKMEVGEISEPFRMKNSSEKEVVAIVRLKSRIKAHQANVSDDFLVLKNLVEARKREEIIENWIKTKQKTTYVRISDRWCDCDFKYPGWIK
jgi:Parvulin-like peptidyl-prolyl isomerase